MIILLFQWVKIIEFVASNSFLILCDFVFSKTVLRLIQTRTFIDQTVQVAVAAVCFVFASKDPIT